MQKLRNIYFLGIGGIGMSALARYFLLKNANVAGYDKTPSSLTDELIAEGINIHFDDDVNKIPVNPDLIVYTPAIPKDNKEFQYFIQKGANIRKRSEVLGLIMQDSTCIAVAGTHGKTTVTTLIAHMLRSAGVPSTAFLGGISKNYLTNFLPPSENSGNIMIAEADEFDRSFLTLFPDYAVITSMDADHLDIYGDSNNLRNSFRDFTGQVKTKGHLILKSNIGLEPANHEKYSVHTYGTSGNEDYHPQNIKIGNGRYFFDLVMQDNRVIRNISPGLPGLFNIENAVAAAAIADQMGISHENIKKAIESYEGVVRRFDYQIRRDDLIYIDDYAHHPAELEACISAVKELYPDRRITGVFQPHLFTRTRDFADDFSRALSKLDELILLEIYPAREKPIPGVTSSMLLNKVKMENKQLASKEELVGLLKTKKPQVLLTMGAGDIDRLVGPIKEAFKLSE